MAKQVTKEPVPAPKEPKPKAPLPTDLPGPIGDRWRALGGMSWGKPQYLPVANADGRGQHVMFRRPSNEAPSIVWTATTGARVIGGYINARWGQLGGGRGLLGYPTSDPMATHDNAGQFQTFEGGIVVHHRQHGAHEVYGDILTRYGQLGGSRFGYPTTGESATPDGRGRYNHFVELPSGAEKSIYWTRKHGAKAVYGMIRAHWAALGWERGRLGYPTSEEADTHDRAGRYQTFEGGVIVWHPKHGAHAVWGDIHTRYGQLGGSAFGYPTTDETKTPDGRGRYSHFVELPSGAVKSIYWSPDTGAHEVYGLIRSQWADLGFERGRLGYPTSGEQGWDAEDSGRRQSFQHGQIIYSARRNAAIPDPLVFSGGLRGGQGFGGNAGVELYSDGRARFFGEATNGAYQDYDYNVYALVHTPLAALAWNRSDQINMQVVGRNRERWSIDDKHGFVGANFPMLANASFELHSNHQGGITGKIDDLLSTFLAWGVTRSLGPLVPIIYLGVSVGAAVTKGSWEAGPRIIAGSMWMLGPEGFLVGMAVDSLARLGTRSRGLLPDEKAFLRSIFKDTVNLDRITLTDTSGKGNSKFAFPSPRPDTDMNLNMADRYRATSMVTNSSDAGLLAHEMVHAWQYKYLANHSSYVLLGIFDTNYEPGRIGKPWYKYNIEQQAEIVERWVERHYTPGVPTHDFGLSSPGANGALADNRFRYIADNIRVGRGR